MRIAAYQFDVTGDIRNNLSIIKNAVKKAKDEGADLIVFCECALTGYIKRDTSKAKENDGACYSKDYRKEE